MDMRVLKVDGMCCENCVKKIEAELAESCVKHYEINLQEKTISVCDCDTCQATTEEILKDLGFESVRIS